MVKGCALVDPIGDAGVTLLIVGVAVGLWTWNWNWPDEAVPLTTSTLQVWASVPKTGLITNCVPVCELIARFGKEAPVVMLRRFTTLLDV
jgi:hypothetical protein